MNIFSCVLEGVLLFVFLSGVVWIKRVRVKLIPFTAACRRVVVSWCSDSDDEADVLWMDEVITVYNRLFTIYFVFWVFCTGEAFVHLLNYSSQ